MKLRPTRREILGSDKIVSVPTPFVAVTGKKS